MMTDKEQSDFLNLQARVVILEERIEEIEEMTGFGALWESHIRYIK